METPGTTTLLQRNDLRELLSFLSVLLKENKGAQLSGDELWDVLYDETCIPSPQSSDDEFSEIFKRSRIRFQNFEGMLKTLRTITSSFEEALRNTEMRMNSTALHRGITRLPFELLSIILGFAVTDFKDACRLSHVCALFRSVILSSPRIWANCELTLHSTSKQLAVTIDRSRGMLLKARVEPNPYIPQSAKGILDHVARIEELRVSPINTQALHDDFNAIELPALRQLCMTWSKFIPEEHVDEPISHIYETWTIPHLEYIETNFIPRPIPGANIVKCRLSFDASAIYVSELLEFLASSSSLEVLDVSFVGTSAWQETQTGPIVDLRNLTSLALQISENSSPSLLDHILGKMTCKNLSELSVVMTESLRLEAGYSRVFEAAVDAEDATATHFKDRSDAVYRFIQKHQSIARLSVLFEVEGSSHEEDIPSYTLLRLGDLLSILPNRLDTLILMQRIVVRWNAERDGCIVPLPNCLSITDGDGWTMDTIRVLQRRLFHSNTEPRRIELTRCTVSHEHRLREMFPGSEVVCRP